jgi:hypothetical protein
MECLCIPISTLAFNILVAVLDVAQFFIATTRKPELGAGLILLRRFQFPG